MEDRIIKQIFGAMIEERSSSVCAFDAARLEEKCQTENRQATYPTPSSEETIGRAARRRGWAGSLLPTG
ncbi:hypothetical protein Trydic_g5668 [Trypoxylus dichotomus]